MTPAPGDIDEVPGVWHKVLARLRRHDVVGLNLPGFGRSLPPGFETIKEAYVA